MEKKFVVYKITHIDTGKSYIGITGNYERRMKDHFRDKDNCYLHRSIRKYGKDKFIHKIIYKYNSWEELCKKEIEFIKIFNTKSPNGYNMTEGGDGTLGRIFSEETRKKLSEMRKGRIFSEETRKKLSKASKGKKKSVEHRKNMSKALKNPSDETREKMSKWQLIFSKNQILEIRKMLSKGIIYKIIAKKFNVHQTTIGGIKRNEQYANIQLP